MELSSTSSGSGLSGPSGRTERVRIAMFHQWKYSHYFVVVDEGEKNMRARCTLCSASSKPLSCARNTTSNFKKHLETVHKTEKLMAVIPESREGRRGGKCKRDTEDDEDEMYGHSKKQATLQRKVSPVVIRSLVAEYIVDDMLPLSTVESPAFRKLVSELMSTSVQSLEIPNRKALSSYLQKVYESMVKKMKETLEGVSQVSTTADVWTAHHRSYLGMTVHWIDHTSLKQRKAAIACIRVIGRHTYDVLAAKIEEVHRNFGLIGKISATVTDNGSNFVKAFATFSVQEPISGEASSLADEWDDDDDEMELEDDVTFANLHDLIIPDQDGEEDLTQIEYELPPHQRCAAHTLNLIAIYSTDVDKHLSSCSQSRSVYRSSFAKCTALWNKMRRSTVAADVMQTQLKRKLLVPSPTRWNSYYDAVTRVIENPPAFLNDLCTSIEIRNFTEKELTFLKEYCTALYPLSKGLDIFQGEDCCYYGTLLPTLATIIKKTKATLPQLSTMTTGLAQTVQSAIVKRFSNIFDSKDAIIAAVTSPKFKLKWVESQEQKDTYRQIMIDELYLHKSASEIVIEEEHVTQAQNKRKDFYEFDTEDEDGTSDDVGTEAMEFLRNAKTPECLEKYPK